MPRCELSVDGRLADAVVELISSRFGPVTTSSGPGRRTTLSVEAPDPAAERALLTLLWDTGHDVVEMRSIRAHGR